MLLMVAASLADTTGKRHHKPVVAQTFFCLTISTIVGQNNYHTRRAAQYDRAGLESESNTKKVYCFEDRFECSYGRLANGTCRTGSPHHRASGFGNSFNHQKTGRSKKGRSKRQVDKGA